jgi:ComF family protein
MYKFCINFITGKAFCSLCSKGSFHLLKTSARAAFMFLSLFPSLFLSLLSSMPSFLSSLARAWADVLAPPHCLLCHAHLANGTHEPQPVALRLVCQLICQRCMDALSPAVPSAELCSRMNTLFRPDEIFLSNVFALYSVRQAVQHHTSDDQHETVENKASEPSAMKLIYALKYGGRSAIGVAFGERLGYVIEYELRNMIATTNTPLTNTSLYDAIVPVPLHHSRERERGYNQARWIAQGITNALHIPLEDSWIRRLEPTRSQTTLSAEARVHNVRNVFAPTHATRRLPASTKKNLNGATVLLVDDVYTTGSTLNACAHALLELGVRRVDAAVLVAA